VSGEVKSTSENYIYIFYNFVTIDKLSNLIKISLKEINFLYKSLFYLLWLLNNKTKMQKEKQFLVDFISSEIRVEKIYYIQ
jgi:hypothetical protein